MEEAVIVLDLLVAPNFVPVVSSMSNKARKMFRHLFPNDYRLDMHRGVLARNAQPLGISTAASLPKSVHYSKVCARNHGQSDVIWIAGSSIVMRSLRQSQPT
ncbi:hypothetical protein ABBQ32_011053 [Trebouxia sp. C0010 RCD-2024]